MKRIRKLIASALTLVMSILVMCVGVYAASSAPKVSISGSVSYDVGACKVRVIGNLSGAYLDANGSGVNAVAKTQVDNNSQACHYYGVHDNAQSETNMLPAWNIGSVYFKETAEGAESFIIRLMVENLSLYPIKASVVSTSSEVMSNVSKEIISDDLRIDVGGKGELKIKYDILDSSKQASLTIGNELVFEKVQTNVNFFDYNSINANSYPIDDYIYDEIDYAGTTLYTYFYTAQVNNIADEYAFVGANIAIDDYLNLQEKAAFMLSLNATYENAIELALADQSQLSNQGLQADVSYASVNGKLPFGTISYDTYQENLTFGVAFTEAIDYETELKDKIEIVAEKRTSFYNTILSDNSLHLSTYFGDEKNVVIPSELEHIDGKTYPVTSVMSECFIANKNIESVFVPGSIKRLENAAFMSCENLKKVTLSEGLEYINGAFDPSISLEEVIIPSTVLVIDAQWSVKKAIVYAPTPPMTTFSSCFNSDTEIYVPSEYVEIYKSSQYWKDNKILPLD